MSASIDHKVVKLRRSVSSASSSSEAQIRIQLPPALPKRNPELGFGRRKAPPLPNRPKSELIRSNSMDRSAFTKNQLLSISVNEEIDFEDPVPDMIDPNSLMSRSSMEVFGMSSSGRHTHVLSPTRETLMEHNMNIRLTGNEASHQKREIDELRARCAQMEKTMKWWSDCTANWREKWSKVRSERNKYKDDLKRAQAKIEDQAHELSRLRNERDQVKVDLDVSFTSQKSTKSSTSPFQVYTKSALKSGSSSQGCQTDLETPNKLSRSRGSQTESLVSNCEQGVNTEELDIDMTVTSANFLASGTNSGDRRRVSNSRMPGGGILSPSSVDSGLHQSLDSPSVKTCPSEEDDQITRFLNDALVLAGSEQATMLKFRLEEALKTVDAERCDKSSLLSEIETLHGQLAGLEAQCDDLRIARQETSRDLLLARNQGQDQIRTLQLQLEDQLAKKNNLDQIIGHLREELERLQSENAEEWGRRERLQTEKQNVERENRKMRMQLEELKERNRRLTSQTNEHTNNELSRLQTQVQSSSHEMVELRHAHNRIRKSLAEKSEELVHWQRRSDVFEKEVKKLRLRIEELKKDLGRAEDELDSSGNSISRLQRSNEELLSQAEGYEVQIEHLTSRLRSLPQNEILPFRRPSRLFPNHMLPDPMINADMESRFSSSEESLPIFDDDDDDLDEDEHIVVSHEIETDV